MYRMSPSATLSEEHVTRKPDYDYLIIGAGVCGLYQLYRLRELGFRTIVLDANSDVGGTWFRNRYPGCRFDSESYTYAYSFSKELLEEWNWSERFAPQPETLRYLQYVADKFSLRNCIEFNTKVVAASYEDSGACWTVCSEDGREYTTRFLLTAMGLLSAPTKPRYEGIEDYQGISFHTFDWPAEGVDLTGKKVAVIGTGATGVQVISAIGPIVGSLTVFQRSANWASPLHNAEISPDEMAEIKRHYDEIFAQCFASPSGFIHRPDRLNSTDVSREERLARWEALYKEPGFGIWLGNYRDTLMDEAANAELSEFIAGKIRQRINDPQLADKLIPKDHGYGTKRVPLETGYYEVYNQANVELVDLNDTPIKSITRAGIVTTEREYAFDVIVYATGFDAVTGPFDRIDITGLHGEKLRDTWSDGPQICLGLQVHGFPNLFTLVGPQSGSVAANFPRGIEDIVSWMSDLASYLRNHGIIKVSVRPEAQQEWLHHVEEINKKVLFSKSKSWFTGYNTNLDREYHPRQLIYTGGAVRYRRILAEEAAKNYPSFIFEASAGPFGNVDGVGA